MNWRDQQDKIKELLKGKSEQIDEVSEFFEIPGILFFDQHTKRVIDFIKKLSEYKSEEADFWIEFIKQNMFDLRLAHASNTTYCCGVKVVHSCTKDDIRCSCFDKVFDSCYHCNGDRGIQCKKNHPMKSLECCNTHLKVCERCVQHCHFCKRVCCHQCFSLSYMSHENLCCIKCNKNYH